MAELGIAVAAEGDRLSGVYPTLLKEVGPAAGCDFVVSQVPRARQQRMLENGQADLLIPASRSPGRDEHAEFVPLIEVRSGLISLGRERPAIQSLQQLVAASDYKLAVVRGFSYGTPYDTAVAQLRAKQRVIDEADVVGVVKALRKGLAQGTIMAPYILASTLAREPQLAPLLKDLRVDWLDEFPWNDAGVYLSRRSLSEADREQLRQAFNKVARSGRAYQLFLEQLTWSGMSDCLRPLSEGR